MPERYEFVSDRLSNTDSFILTEILETLPTAIDHLKNRKAGRYQIESERDIHDLLFLVVKSVFKDARCEENTRKHASSSKRIDIVIPSVETVLEIKYVRNSAHAARVADELFVDFESYYVHKDCHKLIAYIWDQKRLLPDRYNFINDLRGLRQKGNTRFMVEVMVKP